MKRRRSRGPLLFLLSSQLPPFPLLPSALQLKNVLSKQNGSAEGKGAEEKCTTEE